MNPKLLAPLVVLAITVLGVVILNATAPKLARVEPERAIPVVRVIDAEMQSMRHTVRSQGTVVPRTEADLVAEVAGRVVWISPNFAAGGFFDSDEPLVRFEARDYELARDRARASVQRARGERDYASAELKRQVGLSDGGVASVSQLANARRAATVTDANLLDARAALEQTQRDLERTEIRTPYSGRVRNEYVDVGQFVNKGAPIALIYATDYVEIRLPIADDQLAFLDVGKPIAGIPIAIAGAAVKLSAEFAGQRSEWIGRIIRTEGEIDQRSRMVNVVARVEDPYHSDGKTAAVPMAVGLFVHAEIEGPAVENVIVVPRFAMRDSSTLLVVDQEDRLRTRTVEVIRIDRDDVLIKGPLDPGERICVSPVQVVVEGMTVQTLDDPAAVATRNGKSSQ